MNLDFEPVCYTIGQASQMLQVSESTIRRRIHEGIMPRTKICGKILIPAYFFKEEYRKEMDEPC